MKFSTKSRYAITAVIDLANNSESSVSLKDISDRQSISLSYLEQLFCKLKNYGVSEVKEYIKKRITIDEAKDLIKFRTHQYAKRQITWLKHQMISWKSISTQESDKIIDYFIKKL